jgi:16S rRNA processing protein RimM
VPDRGTPMRVPIGEVLGPHGTHGLLRVRLYNESSRLLASMTTVELQRGHAVPDVHRVRRSTPHGRGLWLLELDGVTDRHRAEALRGHRIVVSPADLPALADDEFYHHELIGFTVETTTGRTIGTIAETMPTGLNDVWVVRAGPREHLIPAIADVVETIDRTNRRVVIVAIEGLLD